MSRVMDSWFLPFNRGWNDGAGNPPNQSGIKTDYLWRDVLTRESLTDILENYARRAGPRSQERGSRRRPPQNRGLGRACGWRETPSNSSSREPLIRGPNSVSRASMSS